MTSYNASDYSSALEGYQGFIKFLNEAIEELGFEEPIDVNGYKLLSVFRNAFSDDNFLGGVKGASCFKKVSAFMCHFVVEKPLSSFPEERKNSEGKLSIHAMIGLEFCMRSLVGSIINKEDNPAKVKTLQLSQHAYKDIIYACSQEDIRSDSHCHLLSLLFEQICYKTNSNCQYKDVITWHK